MSFPLWNRNRNNHQKQNMIKGISQPGWRHHFKEKLWMEAIPYSGEQANALMPLYSLYKALNVEGQPMDEVNDLPCTPKLFPKSERPVFCITTISTRWKRDVIFVGSSILRGTEGPIHQIKLPQVRCLPGAWVTDITRKFPSLLWPLTVTHYCFSMWMAMKFQHVVWEQSKEFSGPWARESGGEVIFSSLLPVIGSNTGRNRHV